MLHERKHQEFDVEAVDKYKKDYDRRMFLTYVCRGAGFRHCGLGFGVYGSGVRTWGIEFLAENQSQVA